MKPRRRASTVCVREGKLLTVVLEDPLTGHREYYLPGGGIEANETPIAAAARETFEETGYRVEVIAESERILRYPFDWGGVVYDCTTHFYEAVVLDDVQDHASYANEPAFHKGIVWLPLVEVRARFAYHAEILGEILALLGDRAGSKSD